MEQIDSDGINLALGTAGINHALDLAQLGDVKGAASATVVDKRYRAIVSRC